MTHPGNYIGYIMSRLVAGIFGSVVGVVGPRIMVDIFFLHERGRRFAVIYTANVFGSVFSPTLSGFISGKTSWPAEFWWSAGLVGLILILCFLFLEETGFERYNEGEKGFKAWPVKEDVSWLKNRFQTFVFGQALQPRYTAKETVSSKRQIRCARYLIKIDRSGLASVHLWFWSVQSPSLLVSSVSSTLASMLASTLSGLYFFKCQ